MTIRLMISSSLIVLAGLFTSGCTDSHWDDAGENWKQGSVVPAVEVTAHLG
jgi:hypothetical protein